MIGVHKEEETRKQVRTILWVRVNRVEPGDLLDSGVDLATVQSRMGHSNASITAWYDPRPERAKRDDVRLCHIG